MTGFVIDDDSPESVSTCDVKDEAASLAIVVLRAAKRFGRKDRLRLLEGVCDELADAREKLRAAIRDSDTETTGQHIHGSR